MLSHVGPGVVVKNSLRVSWWCISAQRVNGKLFDALSRVVDVECGASLNLPPTRHGRESMNTSNAAFFSVYAYSTHTMPGRTRPIEKFAEATAKCSPEVCRITISLSLTTANRCSGRCIWQMHRHELPERSQGHVC